MTVIEQDGSGLDQGLLNDVCRRRGGRIPRLRTEDMEKLQTDGFAGGLFGRIDIEARANVEGAIAPGVQHPKASTVSWSSEQARNRRMKPVSLAMISGESGSGPMKSPGGIERSSDAGFQRSARSVSPASSSVSSASSASLLVSSGEDRGT